jgi:hypothetical protein
LRRPPAGPWRSRAMVPLIHRRATSTSPCPVRSGNNGISWNYMGVNGLLRIFIGAKILGESCVGAATSCNAARLRCLGAGCAGRSGGWRPTARGLGSGTKALAASVAVLDDGMAGLAVPLGRPAPAFMNAVQQRVQPRFVGGMATSLHEQETVPHRMPARMRAPDDPAERKARRARCPRATGSSTRLA